MLLWLILLSCVIKVFVQVELAAAITHGKTTPSRLSTHSRAQTRDVRLSWLWLFMMLATQAQIAAMEARRPGAHMAFPRGSAWVADTAGKIVPECTFLAGSTYPESLATLTGFAAIALLLSGGYKRLEHVTTALVAGVTVITVACVAGLPFTEYPVRWGELKTGFDFVLPATGIALAFSTFGITGVGASELFAYPYPAQARARARARARLCLLGRAPSDRRPRVGAPGARMVRVMWLDAWFSMIVPTVATVAFTQAGAPRCSTRRGSTRRGGHDRHARPDVREAGGGTRSVFLVGRMGRAVQDALCRHGGHQLAHGRLPRPDGDLEVARGGGGGTRPGAERLLRLLSAPWALGISSTRSASRRCSSR